MEDEPLMLPVDRMKIHQLKSRIRIQPLNDRAAFADRRVCPAQAPVVEINQRAVIQQRCDEL